MASFTMDDVGNLQRRFSAAQKMNSTISVPSARLFDHNLNHLRPELTLFFKTWCTANSDEKKDILDSDLPGMVRQHLDQFERLVQLNSRPVKLSRTRLSDFIRAAKLEIPQRVPYGVAVQVKGPLRRLAGYFAFVDTSALLEVLHEYVRNAARASIQSESKHPLVVRIGLRKTGAAQHAFFQITDRANGVPENRRGGLFRVQGNAGGRSSLGLESIRELVDSRHGGKVYAKTRSGKGSTFGFSIPLEKRIRVRES